ncbi:MAG TPA: DUF3198 domain-containing protein [Thermoplasmata archaeon]|nr:DUF3198 domain-containing protein [Thermoplasmata archaeon]
MRLSHLPRELRLELSAMFFFPGIILTIFAVNHYLVGAARLPDFLRDIDTKIGLWHVWVAFLGPLLLLGGGWYFFDTIRKRREFARLMDIDSKAKFVRNQDRLERLAWMYLGSEYTKRVQKKKDELNIK